MSHLTCQVARLYSTYFLSDRSIVRRCSSYACNSTGVLSLRRIPALRCHDSRCILGDSILQSVLQLRARSRTSVLDLGSKRWHAPCIFLIYRIGSLPGSRHCSTLDVLSGQRCLPFCHRVCLMSMCTPCNEKVAARRKDPSCRHECLPIGSNIRFVSAESLLSVLHEPLNNMC